MGAATRCAAPRDVLPLDDGPGQGARPARLVDRITQRRLERAAWDAERVDADGAAVPRG